MSPLKKILSLSVGLVVLGTLLIVINTGTGSAQSVHLNSMAAATTIPAIPVTVANTPLPVTGTVNTNINGTPTVNVGSLPAVQLSGTPAVSVSNTASTPLYVDADRPARNSFSASCFTDNYDPVYGQASCTIFTIPAGRQVVIESVSCTAEVAAGQGPAQADLIIPNIPYGAAPTSAQGYYFPLAMTRQTLSTSGVDIWAITNQFRAYGAAPTGGSVDIGVFFRASLPNLNPPQGLSCTIAGYLVP
jgi:hypothetical protein